MGVATRRESNVREPDFDLKRTLSVASTRSAGNTMAQHDGGRLSIATEIETSQLSFNIHYFN